MNDGFRVSLWGKEMPEVFFVVALALSAVSWAGVGAGHYIKREMQWNDESSFRTRPNRYATQDAAKQCRNSRQHEN